MNTSLADKISVLIITLNEGNNMKVLLSDLDFADEIIVVDSFSTDNTATICQSCPKVTFIQHAFENYALQRNFALEQAKNNWILFLDADERLTPELKNEIIKTVASNQPTCVAYYCYRTFMFKNSKLHFSGHQTDKIIRLFKKDKATYSLVKIVHEKLIINGETGVFKNKLIHYSYTDFTSYKAKLKKYGELKALEKFNKGTKANPIIRLLHPLYTFLYNYIIRLGILDGKKGVIICYLNAFSIVARYNKLSELWNKKTLPPEQ